MEAVRSSRDIRQDTVLARWSLAKFNGTLQAVTGFGKTRVGCRAARGMILVTKRAKSVLVTVPRLELKTQWEDQLNAMGISHYCKVMVNNTAAKLAKSGDLYHGYDLCIHDEVHTLPAPEMQYILSIPRKYTLNLSATVERIDKKHLMIVERFPIFDSISYEEALKHGWISPFTIYNIAVPLSDESQKNYDNIDKKFKYWARQVGELSTEYKLLDKGKRASGVTAALMLTKFKDPELAKVGGQFMRNLKLRKDLCLKNENKIRVAAKIAEALSPREGIFFSLDTDFADKVAEDINSLIGKEICQSYHSKLGTKKTKEVLQNLTDKKISLLSTCTKLDMGFDHPTLSYGIVLSGFSSKLTNIQRIGRIVRLVENKNAILINLYTPGTQESSWLETRTQGLTTMNISLDSFLSQILKKDVENTSTVPND